MSSAMRLATNSESLTGRSAVMGAPVQVGMAFDSSVNMACGHPSSVPIMITVITVRPGAVLTPSPDVPRVYDNRYQGSEASHMHSAAGADGGGLKGLRVVEIAQV